jgi:hypothetical protein
LEQLDSADPPLAIDRRYGDRRRQPVAMGLGEPPVWVVYAPLLPLFLLMLTGLYMFVLQYAAKWHSARGAGG